MPGVAPAAKQQGRHVAGTVKARLAGDQAARPFVYKHAGDLATIGKRAAVDRFRLDQPHRAARLVGLGHCPYLLPDRSQEPACGVAELAVDLSQRASAAPG